MENTLINNPTKLTSYYIFNVVFLFMGSALNVFAYQSFGVIVAAIIIYVFGEFILQLPLVGGGKFEKLGYRQVFLVCWFMSGVAAFYANYLGDYSQNLFDAAHFFDLASNDKYKDYTLLDFQHITEGSGVLVIWRFINVIFSSIGIEKIRFLGIIVNISAVAFSSVFAVKMAQLIYGYDTARLKRLITLFSLCGLFWLFASLHVRDAFVLLGVTVLTYSWTLYIVKPTIRNFIILLSFNIFAVNYFEYLRWEFRFLPYVMFATYLVSIFIFNTSRLSKKILIYVFTIFSVISVIVLFPMYLENIFELIVGNNEQYTAGAAVVASSDSLGIKLIVNQPLPIRLILGTAYLFVFPIPFWTGFQLETAYHLFKSLNVLFFYVLLPLTAVSLLQVVKFKSLRTPALMFHLFLFLGFSSAVAVTSLENRHLAAFLVPLIIFSLVTDLKKKKNRDLYWIFLTVFMCIMAMVHFAWLSLKLL